MMKCYYEELGINRDANENEIKTAYRKLALKWHPDKNPACMEEAKERFQLIQQAYEVLSDPQERAWYDNHREQILRGKNSNYEDNCLDVFQYFTVSCFKGYGDDDGGFYTVYREVFEKIAAEDSEFMDDEEELYHIPKFGNSQSNYEEVVGPFYAYWSAYCTKRTYTWLCPYDIKEVKDRRILREIEKDMKKIVQKAKRERNEQVRNLVSFIRKRDKRVLAYKKLLEERAAFNRQKQEQNRLEQIRRRQLELEEMRQNSQNIKSHNDDYEEQLKQLEQEYSSDEEYYEDDNDDSDTVLSEEELLETDHDEEYIDELYCVACSKQFKTDKAFANHGTSKKHRDNVKRLKNEMQNEENLYEQDDIPSENKDYKDDVSDNKTLDENDGKAEDVIRNKTKNKRESRKMKQPVLLDSDCDLDNGEINEDVAKLNISPNDNTGDDDWNTLNKKSLKKSKNKNKSYKNKSNEQQFSVLSESKGDPKSISKSNGLDTETTYHICVTCKSRFESKNKLFSHLKITNHGVYIPKVKVAEENTKSKKTKGKRK